MRQSLQLRLSQHLAMTPQLQQAIRLLQLSTLELQTEVQDALDSNLMLEVVEEEGESGPMLDRVGGEGEVAPVDIPSELSTDSNWDDVYDNAASNYATGEFSGNDFDIQHQHTESLKDHLYWQMSLMRFSDVDRVIGTAVIDAVDDNGYLSACAEELFEGLQDQELELTTEEVEAVIHQIQNFDPPGVAAGSLDECLEIQLLQYPPETPWREKALELSREHLELLAARDYPELKRVLHLDKDALQKVIDLIQSLSPRPGAAIQSSSADYVIPDVFVRKQDGAWLVELNPDAFPRLRVNSQYAGMIQRADTSTDNTTLKTHLQEARWFIKSLRSRSETLLKVATCIVERQKGFFEFGAEAMKPMILHDIAEAVGMHESTISRVTTQKYMHAPTGIYELKYFFSSHVYMRSGAECSSTAIRALLKKLISAENPKKPLSDSKLATVLSDQGIKVARRTVAKYRESLAIPSSSERRILI